MRRRVAALLAAALAGAMPAAAQEPTRLAVHDGRTWQEWWRSDSAPAAWTGTPPAVARALRWRAVRPGLEVAEVRFSGQGEAWRFSVVALRLDPARLRLALDVARDAGGRPQPWSVAMSPGDAAVALNTGMFDAAGPWGWLVLEGRERLAPGRGPASSAFVVDEVGRARIVPADSITPLRTRGTVQWAFQSYPTALVDGGRVHPTLQRPGQGINLDHRDARLAIGTLGDGRVLVAMTRFDALGGAFDGIPFGPTLPEMTAILGALGAREAVFLDGGISAQLMWRDARGTATSFTGWRKVAVGLVALDR